MRIIRVFLVITVLIGLTYFGFDRQLFFYGKNDFGFYHLLPLDIILDDRPDFENGFAIKDKYGFTIAAKGNVYKFNDKEVCINRILGYYYSAYKVVAKIVDENNVEYYIEFVGNTDKKVNQDIIANIWDNDKVLGTNNFKCISFKYDERKIKRLIYSRNYLMFIFIILLIVTTYKALNQFRTMKHRKV